MIKDNFKKGVTSIYVVVFTTLLLSVITVSFIGLIIAESSRTAENKLAQSAYDSALAGLEDAKLAIIAYHDCLGKDPGNPDYMSQGKSCTDIINFMEDENCLMVANALGRIGGDETEVFIRETTSNTGVQGETEQAYTCVTVDEKLPDYRASLSAESPTHIIPLKVDETDLNGGVSKITGVRISWYSDSLGTEPNFANVDSGGKVSFQPVGYGHEVATPPTISVQLIQADTLFTLEDLSKESSSSTTDRGTVFLVPSDKTTSPGVALNGTLDKFIDSNDRQTNTPYTVNCSREDDESRDREFACSLSLKLPSPHQYDFDDPLYEAPEPIRNNNVAYLVLSLPYDQPATDFSIQICKDTDGNCLNDDNEVVLSDDTCDSHSSSSDTILCFDGVQSRVDSTGRANDIFSRIDARVELNDIYFPFPSNELTLSGHEDIAIDKNFWTTPTGCKFFEANADAGMPARRSCNTSGRI